MPRGSFIHGCFGTGAGSLHKKDGAIGYCAGPDMLAVRGAARRWVVAELPSAARSRLKEERRQILYRQLPERSSVCVPLITGVRGERGKLAVCAPYYLLQARKRVHGSFCLLRKVPWKGSREEK